MAVRLQKAWIPLDEDGLRGVKCQLGVYQLANEAGEVQFIGCADARSLFGLKGELEARVGEAAQFRYEVNTAYHTRYRELLMVHIADYGCQTG